MRALEYRMPKEASVEKAVVDYSVNIPNPIRVPAQLTAALPEALEPDVTASESSGLTSQSNLNLPVLEHDDDLDGLLTAAGWPAELHGQAQAVIACESGGNANAVSPTDDWGLFQIHAPAWSGFFGVEASAFLDPAFNARSALTIYQRSGGWGPWACRP